jgi:hypothetical protein
MEKHHCTGPAGNVKYIYIQLLLSIIIICIEWWLAGILLCINNNSLWNYKNLIDAISANYDDIMQMSTLDENMDFIHVGNV